MKKIILSLLLLAAIFSFQACSNDKSKEKKTGDKKEEVTDPRMEETPSNIGKSWCAINKEITQAATDGARSAAKQRLEDYEDWIEKTYKDDEAFRKGIEAEIEKCEAASEGR